MPLVALLLGGKFIGDNIVSTNLVEETGDGLAGSFPAAPADTYPRKTAVSDAEEHIPKSNTNAMGAVESGRHTHDAGKNSRFGDALQRDMRRDQPARRAVPAARRLGNAWLRWKQVQISRRPRWHEKHRPPRTGTTLRKGTPAAARQSSTQTELSMGVGSDWRKAYQRFDDETLETVEKLVADMLETAAEHAPEVEADRREELARESATITILRRRASADAWGTIDGSGNGRGLILTDDDGNQRVNPAHKAANSLRRRGREIAEELCLWYGFQD